MADVLAHNLCIPASASPDSQIPPRKSFRRPDLSTKLKLLGVNVASFGDFFADRDGPRDPPEPRDRGVKALSYRDPFQAVYKKLRFTAVCPHFAYSRVELFNIIRVKVFFY